MAETQGDIYVCEIDARLKRIEALYEKTAAEIRDVKSEMRQLEAKFDGIRSICMWSVMGFWIILALATAFAVIRRIYQPVTLEDVERIAERAANNVITDAVIERIVSGGK